MSPSGSVGGHGAETVRSGLAPPDGGTGVGRGESWDRAPFLSPRAHLGRSSDSPGPSAQRIGDIRPISVALGPEEEGLSSVGRGQLAA